MCLAAESQLTHSQAKSKLKVRSFHRKKHPKNTSKKLAILPRNKTLVIYDMGESLRYHNNIFNGIIYP